MAKLPQQASKGTQTLNLQETSSAQNVSCEDSYFEEGLQNLDFNVQLQSATDDFRLFSVCDVFFRFNKNLLSALIFQSPTGIINLSPNNASSDKRNLRSSKNNECEK